MIFGQLIKHNVRNIFGKKSYTKCGRETIPRPIVCSSHVTYAFQSKFTLYSCLNVNEPLARIRREI